MGVLVIVAIANYWLILPAVLILMMLYGLRVLYVHTSRSIKRIEAISKYNSIAKHHNCQ